MISQAGWWTWIPSATPLQPKKWSAHFWIMFNFWWLAGLVNGLKPHPPPISSQRMKCSFLDYIQLLMIGRAGQWTQTSCTTPLQAKKWNAHFWITFNFWWSAGLVNGFKPHLPPVFSQKNEMPIIGLLSISGDQPGWSMDSNSIHHHSPAKEWYAHFWITFNFLWLARLVNGLEPHLQPLSNQKNEMLIFGLRSTSDDRLGCRRTPNPSATSFQPKNEMLIFVLRYSSDDQPGWSMDSKPIHHPSSQKNEMLIFVLRSTSDDRRGWLMDSNRIHYPSPAKKWNAHFCITFNFWWLAGLVIGLEPHPPPVSSQKKWNAHFWITFNFWWSAGLVDELESHLPPLSNQKNEVLIFGLCSTSDDWPGWSMDSNPIRHLSPAKEWNAHFWITFNFWWSARLAEGWSMDLFLYYEPHPQSPSPPLKPKKWNAHFWITFNFWWSAGLVDELESHLPPLSNQKNEVLIFGLCSTSDDWPGWSMDSNPIRHLSPAKEWNAHFWITFNFWWSARLAEGLQTHLQPLSNQKMKCLFLYYVIVQMISQAGRWTQSPSTTPQAKKMKC